MKRKELRKKVRRGDDEWKGCKIEGVKVGNGM